MKDEDNLVETESHDVPKRAKPNTTFKEYDSIENLYRIIGHGLDTKTKTKNKQWAILQLANARADNFVNKFNAAEMKFHKGDLKGVFANPLLELGPRYISGTLVDRCLYGSRVMLSDIVDEDSPDIKQVRKPIVVNLYQVIAKDLTEIRDSRMFGVAMGLLYENLKGDTDNIANLVVNAHTKESKVGFCRLVNYSLKINRLFSESKDFQVNLYSADELYLKTHVNSAHKW